MNIEFECGTCTHKSIVTVQQFNSLKVCSLCQGPSMNFVLWRMHKDEQEQYRSITQRMGTSKPRETRECEPEEKRTFNENDRVRNSNRKKAKYLYKLLGIN